MDGVPDDVIEPEVLGVLEVLRLWVPDWEGVPLGLGLRVCDWVGDCVSDALCVRLSLCVVERVAVVVWVCDCDCVWLRV